MPMVTQWKDIKRFLKTNPVTRKPVRYAVNSRARLRWRLLHHRRALSFPTVINIETTNECNEECWFCPRAEATRGFGYVSLDLVKSIVDQGVPHGGITYYLHKDGEPLMHPRIFDIIEYMVNAHPDNKVRLTTNGTILKEQHARRLIELGVEQIRIGIRSATRETFLKIHKLDLFDHVKRNIERLLRLQEEMQAHHLLVIVQIVVCEDTKDEIDLFRQQWGDKDVFMEIKDFMSWGGWAKDPTLAGNNGDPRRPPCIDPFHNLVVNWDGKVSLCSLDWNCSVPLGNVAHSSVEEVWNGEAVRAIREAHLKGNFQHNAMCANCEEWRYLPSLFWRNRTVLWKDQKWV